MPRPKLSEECGLPSMTVIGFLCFVIGLLLLERSTGERDSCVPGPSVVAAPFRSLPSSVPSSRADVADEDDGLEGTTHETCPDHYYVSFLLSRFIDIDFIEFVLGSHPKPALAKVVDIGIYEAKGLVHMARMGFSIEAYEASPTRYNICMADINNQPESVQQRIALRNLAVSDSPQPMCFQLAGLDSHMYTAANGSACHKEKSVTVQTIPMAKVVTRDTYFVKIDTQGFDTRILEQLIESITVSDTAVAFIQFEFTPYFEVTRAGRTKADHGRVFRRLIDAGYDLFQGGALQPWNRGHRASARSRYGKTPLSMVAVARGMPTCLDSFLDRMHDKDAAVFRGKTSTEMGMWMDILAVRRAARSPYYRHTGWVLSRSM